MNGTLKVLYFLGILAEIVIRFPHELQRRRNRIAVDRVTGLERSLVGLVSVGLFFIPAIYTFTSWLDKADYCLSPRAKGRVGGLGVVILAGALWMFWRSHADLGRNWSPSLQLRGGHTLVTEGVYRAVRHPMYASMWLWGIAQTLLLQNWIAG
jgi:protein-S-isoprenylcysteine O-methyltransferase Ste14